MTMRTRHGMRRVVAAVVSVLLSVAILGGCGDDKPSDEPGSAPQDTGG